MVHTSAQSAKYRSDILLSMIKVVAGDNFYLIKDHISKIKSDFTAEYGDMSVEEIDCEEIELNNLLNAMQSSPLFSEKKLVIARNISRNKDLSGQIEKIMEAAPSANDLIIVEKDLDKRSAYYKFLKKIDGFIEFSEPDENQLISWLCEGAEQLGADLSEQNARYLINRAGPNQLLLSNELKKLSDYDMHITRENIDSLTAEKPQSSIFNLIDAAFSGNSKLALKLYDEQKTQGAEPQSIFGMIVWQTNIIATVAVAGSQTSGELAAKTGIKPFSVAKASGIYKRIGRQGVNNLLDKLVHADKQMKTASVEPDEVLKNLLITIS